MVGPTGGGGVAAAGWGRDNDGGLESDCTAQTGLDLAAGTSAVRPCHRHSERNGGKNEMTIKKEMRFI